jgi:hypothetical protein
VDAYAISLPILIFGIYDLHSSIVGREAPLTVGGSHIAKELTPLSLNIGVTLLTECLGLIHAITLRWNMQLEGTLSFNSSPRLFTSSRRSVLNSWICNILNAMFFISSYSSTSLVFLPEPSQPMADPNNFFDDESEGIFKDENFESLVDKLHVSGIAMVTLGGGLLGQALLATWAYCAVSVPTWSSSPIDTALACQQRGIKKLEGHTMLSVGDTPQHYHPIQFIHRRLPGMPITRSAGSLRFFGLSSSLAFSGPSPWRMAFK